MIQADENGAIAQVDPSLLAVCYHAHDPSLANKQTKYAARS